MKVLITGASGFVGTNLLQYLSQFDDVQIIAFDRRYDQDIRNLEAVKNAISKGYDFVYHLAALTHIDTSIKQPIPFFETNVMGTLNVLEACKEFKTPLVYISSSEVYGTKQTEDPQSEDHPLAGHSPYAATKVAADRMCYSYWQTYEIPIAIVRPFNMMGMYQDIRKVIPKFLQLVTEGKPLPVYAEGLAKRDWLFIRDSVRGMWMARNLCFDHPGQPVNLCTGKSYNLLELCELIKKTVGKKVSKIIHISHVDDRFGHVYHLEGNYERAKKWLGWEPKYQLPEALKITYNWYLANGFIRFRGGEEFIQ